jgi:hypothetical protein
LQAQGPKLKNPVPQKTNKQQQQKTQQNLKQELVSSDHKALDYTPQIYM